MKAENIKKVHFLLVLYLLVLVHSAIAHQFDSEFLCGMLSRTDEEIPDDSHKVDLCNKEFHFNVFSNDINLDKKVQVSISGGFALAVSTIPHYPFSDCDIYYIPTTISILVLFCFIFYLLRAPPFIYSMFVNKTINANI